MRLFSYVRIMYSEIFSINIVFRFKIIGVVRIVGLSVGFNGSKKWTAVERNCLEFQRCLKLPAWPWRLRVERLKINLGFVLTYWPWIWYNRSELDRELSRGCLECHEVDSNESRAREKRTSIYVGCWVCSYDEYSRMSDKIIETHECNHVQFKAVGSLMMITS